MLDFRDSFPIYKNSISQSGQIAYLLYRLHMLYHGSIETRDSKSNLLKGNFIQGRLIFFIAWFYKIVKTI